VPKTDAIALLKKDHARVKALLAELEHTTERAAKRREKLLAEIVKELQAHTRIEEELFYPAYRDAVTKKEDTKLYYEAVEEHRVVDFVIPDILECDPGATEFAAKVKVLKELVEHHAKEEERDMFPRARRMLGAAELQDLGARMAERKEELEAVAS
jgi:hemerythrin superfamily protein